MFHKSMCGLVVDRPLFIVMFTVQLLVPLFLTCFSHFAIVLCQFDFRITNIYIYIYIYRIINQMYTKKCLL